MSEFEEQKKIVLEAAKKFLKTGLTIGTSGNISLRTGKKAMTMAITPSSREYDELTIDDIIVVDFSNEEDKIEVIEGKWSPSSETILHSLIYKKRKKINAIIHYHPVFSTACGLVLNELPAILDDQTFFLGGSIPITKDYAVSGSKELAYQVQEAIAKTNALIIRNHGAIGIGRSMDLAFEACQLLEKTAKIYVYANLLGKDIKILNDKAIKNNTNIFKAIRF
ncbi:MAG: class II aldolase/adducin family protein [Candidatus Helarchaeota archaeon]